MQRQKQGVFTPYNASLAAEHLVSPHTHYQHSASMSYRPSDFISTRPPSSSELQSLKGTNSKTDRNRKHQGVDDG
jgi:hypothetical protein